MPDTPIAELAGISQGAVVALTRLGVSTVEGLLKADFHEVAYALDSYDDAEALVRTAMKCARGEARSDPARAAKSREARPAPAPAPSIHMDLVGSALGAVWDSLCEGRKCAEAFDELIRRIEQARLVAELDETGAATAAALASGESGRPIEGAPQEIADLIAGAESLLVVAMTPGGAGRQAHAKRLQDADGAVRLLVAARALASLRQILGTLKKHGPSAWSQMDAGREGTLWYYRTLLEALAQVDTTPLVDQFQEAVKALEQAPVAKAA